MFEAVGVTQIVSSYGYLAVGAIVGLESVGIPLPGETTLIAAAVYAGATHNIGIAGVIMAAVFGAILGDNCGYAIGHWGGYRLLVKYGRYIRMHQGRVKVARYLFEEHGGKVVFFGRFIAILRTYAAFLAGTTRMSWRRFLVFNAAGGIVWAAGYGIAAYSAGTVVQQIRGPIAIVFTALAVVVTMVMAVVVHKKESLLSERAEKRFPGPLSGYSRGT